MQTHRRGGASSRLRIRPRGTVHFPKSRQCFPRQLCHCTLLPAKCEGDDFSASLSVLTLPFLFFFFF